MSHFISVLKFGSSVLATEDDLPTVVDEILRERDAGHRVIAVVSAFKGTTDALLQQATRHAAEPCESALAALVSTGELASAALLAVALRARSVAARVVDAAWSRLTTAGPRLDAIPIGLDPGAICRAFRDVDVVVFPGFVGCGADGAPTLLGRGGSDLTAVYIAHAVGAVVCRLLKDVDGVYTADPNRSAAAMRYAAATWEDVLRDGAQVVQPKAVRLARRLNRPFSVAAPGQPSGTDIGWTRAWYAPLSPTTSDPSPRVEAS